MGTCNYRDEFKRDAVQQIGTLKGDCVAIDGSKFKALNNRDRNFTKGKIASRIAHLEADVEHYITEMVRIDRQEEGEARTWRLEPLTVADHTLIQFGKGSANNTVEGLALCRHDQTPPVACKQNKPGRLRELFQLQRQRAGGKS
jgi:hypothetical protein